VFYRGEEVLGGGIMSNGEIEMQNAKNTEQK
jgi:hypothetical protein